MDKRLLNVSLLGLAFMFVFTAFQTMGNIEVNSLYYIKYLDNSNDFEKEFSRLIHFALLFACYLMEHYI